MLCEIDVPHRRFCAAYRGFDTRFRSACYRDDRSIVVGIHLATEQVNVARRQDRFDDRVDDFGPPSLAEIRNALNDSVHWIFSIWENRDYVANSYDMRCCFYVVP